MKTLISIFIGALACLVMLGLLTASAPAQSPVFGVLNASGNDNFSGQSADYWIGQAEIADNGGACTGNALSDEGNAEKAYLQWQTNDAANGVTLVEIPVKWKYFWPNPPTTWSTYTATTDACYSLFLTDVFSAYHNAGYKIAFTANIWNGPSWLSDTQCPNCLYVGNDSSNPSSYNGSTTTALPLPNLVWSNQVRNLALHFVDAAYALYTQATNAQPDYVRVGVNQSGEAGFPAAYLCTTSPCTASTYIYNNEWWAFDNAAQQTGSSGDRAPHIPVVPDCLFGWYPGKGNPTSNYSGCSPTTSDPAQATVDWWSWYFQAQADVFAWYYHLYRTAPINYTGPIAIVDPGHGILPDHVMTDLSDIAGGNLQGYDADNGNETVNLATANWALFNEISYKMVNVYNMARTYDLLVDISSVQADASPSYNSTDSGMNPVAECNYGGTDSNGTISTPAGYPQLSAGNDFSITSINETITLSGFPSTFDNWSSIRQLTYYTGKAVPIFSGNMGENVGEQPFTGRYQSSRAQWITGMQDVMTLVNSCNTGALMWAFDNELQYASIANLHSCTTDFPGC